MDRGALSSAPDIVREGRVMLLIRNKILAGSPERTRRLLDTHMCNMRTVLLKATINLKS